MAELNITINGLKETLTADTGKDFSLQDLITEKKLQGKRIAVELNEKIVSRSQFQTTKIHQGDRIEIVAAIGGG